MNINISQNTGSTELLGSDGVKVIQKLYELATDPNNTLTLSGNIGTTAAYENQVSYLTTNYPNLYINAQNLYMSFEDPEVERILKTDNNLADTLGVKSSEFSNATSINATFAGNTAIENFSELLKTKLTSLPDFEGCTGLRILGIPSTLLYIGGNNRLKDVLLSKLVFANNADIDSIFTRLHTVNVSYGFLGISKSNPFKLYYENGLEVESVSIDCTNAAGTSAFGNSDVYISINKLHLYNNNTGSGVSGGMMKQSTIKELYIHENIIKANYNNFEGSNLSEIFFPESFTEITGNAFKSTSYAAICMSPTPFSKSGNTGTITKFYVPNSATSAWSSSFSGVSVYSLDTYANEAEANKEKLESMGCTVTGTYPNYTVLSPAEV